MILLPALSRFFAIFSKFSWTLTRKMMKHVNIFVPLYTFAHTRINTYTYKTIGFVLCINLCAPSQIWFAYIFIRSPSFYAQIPSENLAWSFHLFDRGTLGLEAACAPRIAPHTPARPSLRHTQ